MKASEISVTGDNVFESWVLNRGPSGLHARPHETSDPKAKLAAFNLEKERV